MSRFHCYPRTSPERQPSPWWYWGRALYVSRRDYFKIWLALVLCLGVPMVAAGAAAGSRFWLVAAFGVGAVSLAYLAYSLLGMYRMYGHPARQYLRRLLERAEVFGPLVVADLHIGTYRHAYALAELLPEATVHALDVWDVKGPPAEAAVQDVRELELPPRDHARVRPARAAGPLPLADGSCDVVSLGFGTHELPLARREALMLEARRVLRPGGKLLLFEHGNDFHNIIIFGPVIGHVTRREDWMELLRRHFGGVGYERTSHAVDLFWARKDAPIGSVSAPLPPARGMRSELKNWGVVSLFAALTVLLAWALEGVALLPILYGMAALGLTWPWLSIGLALLADLAGQGLEALLCAGP